MTRLRYRLALVAATALAACASSPLPSAPLVPLAIQAPSGEVAFLEALAVGAQVYECSAKGDSTFAWVFKGPEASLMSKSGKLLGKHFAGPTWQAEDGSAVVGDVKGSDPGPTASAIPWLLLSAKSTSGSGVLSATKSVQRVATVGGIAPSEACGKANVGQVAKVKYSATYYFYRAAS